MKTTITFEIFEEGFKMREVDYEHVFNQIKKGYHSGELCLMDENENECRGWWNLENNVTENTPSETDDYELKDLGDNFKK